MPICTGTCWGELSSPGRRGRPDIAHRFLSLCLDSKPGRQGRIHPFIHTLDNRVIEVRPGAAIPWNSMEFLELMGRLFKGREVDGFTINDDMDLRRLVSSLSHDAVISLSPQGEEISLTNLYSKRDMEQVTILVGGFAEGDRASTVYELLDFTVSLRRETLRVWAVTCRVRQSRSRVGKWKMFLPAPLLQAGLRAYVLDLQAGHSVAKVFRDLCEDEWVVVVGHRFHNSLGHGDRV